MVGPMDLDALIPTLRDSEPIQLDGVAAPVTIVLKPLACSELDLLAAVLRKERVEGGEEFDRERATPEATAAWQQDQARKLARYQVRRLEIAGEDRTADAEAFLCAYAARRPIAFQLLANRASSPATFGGESPPVEAEDIPGNSPSA